MLWADKVEAWKADEVTKAFFAEIGNDISSLTTALIETEDSNTMYRLQGMLRALHGVLGMPTDGIEEPITEEGVNHE